MIITKAEDIQTCFHLTMTSIGGSPIHEGHCRLIRDCKVQTAQILLDEYLQGPNPFKYGIPLTYSPLLVVVNCDDFLIRKHGYVFQNEDSRAEILDAIKDVDYVYIHKSETQTVDEVLRMFKPKFFCKGGDRSGPQFMPEIELKAAEDIGCTILYGVGGTEKVVSSTTLIDNIVNVINERNKGRDDLGQTTKNIINLEGSINVSRGT